MHQQIEQLRPHGGFAPRSITDGLFDLDGTRTAQWLYLHGYAVVAHADLGTNGIVVTQCGIAMSTNGYVSSLPEGVEVRGIATDGTNEHGVETIQTTREWPLGEPEGFAVYVRQPDGTAQWHSDHENLCDAVRAARGARQ